MQPFVVNGHDQIVFPSNFVPELDDHGRSGELHPGGQAD
jgi:hypothetical protein